MPERYDPLELTEELKALVVDGKQRQYHRFRSSPFKDSAVADCVGCNLRCDYCWGHFEGILDGRSTKGGFYAAKDVIAKLVEIAEEEQCENLRISGAEPILEVEHTLALAQEAEQARKTLILETNGIVPGNNEELVAALAQYENVHLRISLKGSTAEEFAEITGAIKDAFTLQQNTVRFARKHDLSFSVATISLLPEESQERLKAMVRDASMDVEQIVPHPAKSEKAGRDL